MGEMDDIGVQTSFTISKNDSNNNNNDDASESQDIGVQTTHDEFLVESQKDIVVQDIEVEEKDDEVTIMIGEESFAAVNNSMMNISRMESGKENVAPTNNENDDENSNIASQRSRIEVSSSSG